MADQNAASVISVSYGICEAAVGAAYAQAENTIFEQIALQGQSVFSSTGDFGAFNCLPEHAARVRWDLLAIFRGV